MFSNRYTAFIDACVLARVLPRNLLLSLAEAGFYRVRWSLPVLKETEVAIAKILAKKSDPDPAGSAARNVAAMRRAFAESEVVGFEAMFSAASGLPDKNDHHVVAAALKAQASAIVTDNLRHFPSEILVPLAIEVRSADDFIADTIALDLGRAVTAIRTMRQRLSRPDMDGAALLSALEANGLLGTADMLRSDVGSI
jgi:PIN domain